MANLFPTELPVEESMEQAKEEVFFGRSWRFDFDAGEFIMTPTGQVASSEGKEAWIEWCRKALLTERYKHLVYSRNYGQEFEELIRSSLPRAVIEMEIKRIAVETLMSDPRTARVDRFSCEWRGESCYFTCAISNIHDETAEIEGMAVNV